MQKPKTPIDYTYYLFLTKVYNGTGKLKEFQRHPQFQHLTICEIEQLRNKLISDGLLTHTKNYELTVTPLGIESIKKNT